MTLLMFLRLKLSHKLLHLSIHLIYGKKYFQEPYQPVFVHSGFNWIYMRIICKRDVLLYIKI